jgi:hypothetical protein
MGFDREASTQAL